MHLVAIHGSREEPLLPVSLPSIPSAWVSVSLCQLLLTGMAGKSIDLSFSPSVGLSVNLALSDFFCQSLSDSIGPPIACLSVWPSFHLPLLIFSLSICLFVCLSFGLCLLQSILACLPFTPSVCSYYIPTPLALFVCLSAYYHFSLRVCQCALPALCECCQCVVSSVLYTE